METVKTKYTGLLCILLVLTLMLRDGAGCSTRAGPMFQHRKVFLERKETGFEISSAPVIGSYGNNEMPEDWELRRVPAGPDPLHHNGQDPKKPRSP